MVTGDQWDRICLAIALCVIVSASVVSVTLLAKIYDAVSDLRATVQVIQER